MTALDQVALSVATPSDAPVLANLLELYSHELSDVFNLDIGEDGRYGYAKLPLYWSEPERRFPFLIRVGGRIGGFALITRGSPGSNDPDVYDFAEFFVVRRHQRSGVGRQGAFLVWERFAGNWIVRVSEGNRSGVQFWASAISEYTGNAPVETSRPGSPHAWRVFAFHSQTSKR